MRIVVALGEIYGARNLIPIRSAQVSGVSYKNLGDAGLEFLEEWAAEGARVRVPALMNPAGMDLERWREMGISPEFAAKQERVVVALTRMGVTASCTCTPYLVGHRPGAGEHIAWSESSAVSYANSVLGARSNREGGPGALAAAIVGCTAAYGLHLSASRWATHRVDVLCSLRDEADFGALGYWVGSQVADGVPYLRLLHRHAQEPAGRTSSGSLPSKTDGCTIRQEELMALGAAMGASGAVALYHIEGVTPEAEEARAVLDETRLPRLVVDDLGPAFAALNSPLERIDFVSLGCPHSTLGDIERVAKLLMGKRVRATFWVTTSRGVASLARERGWVEVIESAGGRVFSDTCLVVAPVEEMGFTAMATNSAKAAFYAPTHSRLQRRFGTLEQCVEAALSGTWSPGAAEAG
jgi:hypothetical protein